MTDLETLVAREERKQADQTKPARKKPSTAVEKASAVFKETLTTELGQRPYTLESSSLTAEITRQRDAALSELDAIAADILSIEERANRDKQAIQARADAEIEGRARRAEDLRTLVAMAERALTAPAEPMFVEDHTKAPSNLGPSQEDLAASIEAQRQGGDA